MEEAKHSFNVKFRMQGFECQLTIRDDDVGTGIIVAQAQATVRMLAGLKGITATNGNGHAAPGSGPSGSPRAAAPPAPELFPEAPAEPVCPTCGQSDKLELIPFERDGKPRQAYKCQRCKKWLPDKKK
jgi:hypothetical protein